MAAWETSLVTDVRNGTRNDLRPGIIQGVKRRFESFEGDIFKSISAFADHNRWNFEDSQYGIKDIQATYQHFRVPLNGINFNRDLAESEYRGVQRIVENRYQLLTLNAEGIDHYQTHANLRNIFISELILGIKWAF